MQYQSKNYSIFNIQYWIVDTAFYSLSTVFLLKAQQTLIHPSPILQAHPYSSKIPFFSLFFIEVRYMELKSISFDFWTHLWTNLTGFVRKLVARRDNRPDKNECHCYGCHINFWKDINIKELYLLRGISFFSRRGHSNYWDKIWFWRFDMEQCGKNSAERKFWYFIMECTEYLPIFMQLPNQ